MTDLLAGLTPQQRRAAQALDGPVVIKAGPGSGKTRTITHRIAYGVASGRIEAPRTLALTFTARAAGELHERLVALAAGDVAVRTFHSAALRQLRHFWPDAVGGAMPRVVADRRPLLATAASDTEVATDRATISLLATELDWLKAGGLVASGYVAAAAGRDLADLDPARIAAVLGRYEVVKSQEQAIDFDDVLLITIGLLESRTDLRESVRRAFRSITVDEYQDVSPLQQRLLDAWVGDRNQVCVVGDAAQAIYQFAGADPTLLTTFRRRFPDATVVELPVTFRCATAITAAANSVGGRIPGALRITSAPGAAAGSIRALEFPSAESEAAGVADEIAGLIRGGQDPHQIAVLYRIHAQGWPFIDELRRRGVPISVRSGDRFFDRPEVTEALTRFRGMVRTGSDRPPADLFDDVRTAMGVDPQPPDTAAARDRWESLAAIAQLVARHPSADAALTDLERRAASAQPPPAAGVTCTTLHAAKGLEWDSVFIVGATDTSLPFVRATTAQAQDEEVRLFYVGVTRARRQLTCTWSGPPSPFLRVLVAEGVPVEEPPTLGRDATPVRDLAGTTRPPARCRVCGRALVTGAERVLRRCHRCPGNPNEAVFAALVAWRDRVAADQQVPPHVVMTDVTVSAIAELQPRDDESLGAIPGMRPDRVREYGPAILAAISQFRGHPPQTREPSALPRP